MISRKNRPTNGPGANHLRGGTRLYSEKTAVGGWIERSGGPSGYHRGFSTDEFETEQQHQQYGLGKPKFYGAGLPLDEEVVHPREVKDIFHPRSGPAAKDWKSNSHAMMESVLVPKIEHNYNDDCGRTISNNNQKHEIEEYRASWTTDTAEGRKIRFNTESRRSANTAVNESFQVLSLRLVPGVPNGFERILAELTNRFGILGLTALRYELWSSVTGRSSSRSSSRLSSSRNIVNNSNNDIISSDDFKIVLKICDVKLTRIEFAQVMAYLTTCESFSIEKLMTILTPIDDDFQPDRVSEKYNQIFRGKTSIKSDDLLSLYPFIEKELAKFIPVYASSTSKSSNRQYRDNDNDNNNNNNDNQNEEKQNGSPRTDYEIKRDGFVLLHTDLFHSVPLKYKKFFK